MSGELNEQLAQWRHYLASDPSLAPADLDELESHLRDQIDALQTGGLSEDEAFLISVKRLGARSELSREFAREHSDRLWKQLVLGGSSDPTAGRRPAWLAVVFASAAAVAVKLPELFGAGGDVASRNAPLIVLAALGLYFLVRIRTPRLTWVVVAVSVVAAACVVNLYPYRGGADTEFLAVAHSSAALWLVIGMAYAAGQWRSDRSRMDYVRFTGEWMIYLALIGLGGVVLIALTVGVFKAIGIDLNTFAASWLLPCGVAGAVVIAAWLVEAKQSVIENMAPVLTSVFTPMFTVVLVAFVVAALAQLAPSTSVGLPLFGVSTQRELLIIFDATLIVVLGLLLYSLSAREATAPARWFDVMQLVMILAALGLDVIVLSAMVGRISAFGQSPNKIASLGLNLILLVNLAWSAWLQTRFLRGRTTRGVLERWQTSYLPVYLIWCALAAIVLPPIFGFS